MAVEQSMTQTIIQAAIKDTKAAIMAIKEADNTVNNARPIYTMPRLSGQPLKQATFDCRVAEKYQELQLLNRGKNSYITNN